MRDLDPETRPWKGFFLKIITSASRQASRQAGKQASRQAGKQAGKQSST